MVDTRYSYYICWCVDKVDALSRCKYYLIVDASTIFDLIEDALEDTSNIYIDELIYCRITWMRQYSRRIASMYLLFNSRCNIICFHYLYWRINIDSIFIYYLYWHINMDSRCVSWMQRYSRRIASIHLRRIASMHLLFKSRCIYYLVDVSAIKYGVLSTQNTIWMIHAYSQCITTPNLVFFIEREKWELKLIFN